MTQAEGLWPSGNSISNPAVLSYTTASGNSKDALLRVFAFAQFAFAVAAIETQTQTYTLGTVHSNNIGEGLDGGSATLTVYLDINYTYIGTTKIEVSRQDYTGNCIKTLCAIKLAPEPLKQMQFDQTQTIHVGVKSLKKTGFSTSSPVEMLNWLKSKTINR